MISLICKHIRTGNRSAFSIIEIVMLFVVIGIAALLVAPKAFDAAETRKFNQNFEKFYNDLKYAREVAITEQRDNFINFPEVFGSNYGFGKERDSKNYDQFLSDEVFYVVIGTPGITGSTKLRYIGFDRQGRFVGNEDKPVDYNGIIFIPVKMKTAFMFYEQVIALRTIGLIEKRELRKQSKGWFGSK